MQHTMNGDPDRSLAELIRLRSRPDGIKWVDDSIAAIESGSIDVAVAFPAAGRHVGRGGLDSPSAELVTATGDRVSLAAWRIDDAARVRLLLADARRDPAGALDRVRALYEHGDARERVGALRALPWLPGAADSAAALPIVLDAMRVTQGEVFEAAILDNPYAGQHLPQHEWRKAVLKTMFIGMSIRRIARIEARTDAELARSLVELAVEREAATRAVSPELWPVAALFPPPGLGAKLLGYLEHPDVEHRAAAAIALIRLAGTDARLRPFLIDHAEREPIAAIRDTLRRAFPES
jgi:hypothetical protein